MSIAGIGTDIVAVDRIARVWQRFGERFAAKLLMAEEREALLAARQPANFLAKAFAAKEAFVKAYGSGFRGIGHQDVGVVRDALGAPRLVFSRVLQAQLAAADIASAHLSLSDDDGRVLAFVVLERK